MYTFSSNISKQDRTRLRLITNLYALKKQSSIMQVWFFKRVNIAQARVLTFFHISELCKIYKAAIFNTQKSSKNYAHNSHTLLA